MVLNPDSLEVEGEFELPAGVGALAWSPDGESLVGVQLSRESSAGALLRLGRDGRVIEVHPFELPPGSDATLATLLRDLPELGVYVLFVSALMGRASILTFDRDSLGLRSACTTNYVAKPTDLLAAASDQVWLSENGGDYLPMVQLSTCNRLGAMAMDTPGNFGMGHFLSKPGEARVLLTLGGVSSNSVVGATLDSGAMLPSRGASFYESFMIPTILAADPTHPGLALAAVHTSRGVEPARVGWFDLESELYLPGAVEVGSGIAARIRTRGDGVFYLLMGRTGGIVRVRTR